MSDNERDIFEEANDMFGDGEGSMTGADIGSIPHHQTLAGDVGARVETKPTHTPTVDNEPVIYMTISDPEKIGDGMSAFMVYRVNTKTTMPSFRKPELSVRRRFSDFLGLHEKLAAKHLCSGIFIPPPPEKSVLGMTKIKMSKEDSSGFDFVEHRRAALERFLVRISRHPTLRMDPDFREFLEYEGDLPRSSSTHALSSAGVMRLFKNVGEAVGKIAYRMDEADQIGNYQWFEDKQMEIDNLEKQLTRLYNSFDSLICNRKELAANTMSLAKSCSVLANVEEHTGLARALTQLAETHERLEQIHSDQAEADYYIMAENIKDYLQLILAAKEALHERVKVYRNWKDTEVNLAKKREQKIKLELSNKYDKMAVIENDIRDLENRVERGKDDFERISTCIKQEMAFFDIERVKDFKAAAIQCLEAMVVNQEKVIQYWEAYLPEAKAIS